MKIVLYKTATCPQCSVVKKKLEQKGLPFTEITDLEGHNLESIPTLEVDGERMNNIRKISKWIEAQEVNNG